MKLAYKNFDKSISLFFFSLSPPFPLSQGDSFISIFRVEGAHPFLGLRKQSNSLCE